MDEPTTFDGLRSLRAGSRFGNYRLRRLLGKGGFGHVWEAEDTAMDRVVALKLLRSDYSGNEKFRQRLFREAHAAGRLHEPHVVPIHQCGEIDGQLYIDMRLIDGTDLETVLAEEGPLAPARAVAVVRQIALALDAAHSAGLIHRDVKPANILLGDDDSACLLDFGLANAATDAKLTSTGFAIGTFAYMSPELLDNGEVDHRADIYALACVLYECLTGSRPYTMADRAALITAHLMAPIPQPSQHGSDIPAAFDDVISRGMAKNPKDRFASAGELASGAQRALIAPLQGRADVTPAGTQAATGPTASPSKTNPEQVHAESKLASTQVAADGLPAKLSATIQPTLSPDTVATPEPTWQQLAGSAKRSPIRATTVAPLVLAVLFLGYAAFAVMQFLRPDPQLSTAPPQWQPYVDFAKEFTISMTSLSYQDPDSAIRHVLDESTGQFHDDFASKSSDFKQTIIQSKVDTQGTVTGAGLESINGTTAKVLVASTSKITNDGATPEEPRAFRLRIQVEKIGDAYKASNVEFMP